MRSTSKAALGEMHARRLHIEYKTYAFIGKSIGELNIFGTAEAFVKTACSQNMAPSK